jgi:hypothetical protein
MATTAMKPTAAVKSATIMESAAAVKATTAVEVATTESAAVESLTVEAFTTESTTVEIAATKAAVKTSMKTTIEATVKAAIKKTIAVAEAKAPPGASADENAAIEPFRAVISVGSAAVGVIAVIAIGAGGRAIINRASESNAEADVLGVRVRSREETNT